MVSQLRSLVVKSKPGQDTGTKESFCPPNTWRAHRSIELGPCKCSVEIMSMDPLMAAAFHNLPCSRLCQLPQKVLVGIMKLLDPLHMQCLRQTCRLFLRLYCDPSFADSHDVQNFWHWMSQYQHWLSPDKRKVTVFALEERDIFVCAIIKW